MGRQKRKRDDSSEEEEGETDFNETDYGEDKNWQKGTTMRKRGVLPMHKLELQVAIDELKNGVEKRLLSISKKINALETRIKHSIVTEHEGIYRVEQKLWQAVQQALINSANVMKFLVCVDGSGNADAAFNRALEIYHSEGDELFVLFCHSGDNDEGKKLKEKETVQKYAKILLDKDTHRNKVRSQMIAEAPSAIGSSTNAIGELILKKAAEFNIDAIVIGRRGMSSMQRLFAGSVSRYIMENAPCDVIVVKSPKPPVSK